MREYILEFTRESFLAVSNILLSFSSLLPEFRVIVRRENLAVVRADLSSIKEMAFLNYASEVLTTFEDLDELSDTLLPDGTFHVRVTHYLSEKKISESALGSALQGKRSISFKNPDFIVRAVYIDKWYLGILKFQRDRKFENRRRAPLRPFFSPITLPPKYARFLVNLSQTRSGDRVLDPFCGTGGILIEAALMGRKVTGVDVSLRMVSGSRLNLKYYNLSGTVLRGNIIGFEFEEKFDAIITDPPYGRSSPNPIYSVDELYSLMFPKFFSLLRDSGYISMITPDMELVERYSASLFDVVSVTSFRQHRSLTRYFVSLRKRKVQGKLL